MTIAVGIDLGTTFSVAAYAEREQIKVIPSIEGGNLIPSVFAVSGAGTQLVGSLAKAQAVGNPSQTVFSVKRLMGSVQKIKLNGNFYTPQEISGFILQKVRKNAEAFIGQEVKKAVITAPAYFNDNQRQATIEAANLAELEVMKIISEPTAASLAYGLHLEDIRHVLVWDLGGGTFDVSILELGQGVFEVKSVNGDTHLGGDDWDQRISDYIAEKFWLTHKFDVRDNRIALQRLKEAAERAKIKLSHERNALIKVPFIFENQDLEVNLTRTKFEDLCKDLVEKLVTPTLQALEDAKLKTCDIDSIILVGGSIRMPSVQQLARELLKKEPYMDLNPDEVVAVGAAIQAGVLAGEMNNVTLVDVTPLSLGIETMGGISTKIIERNTVIPTSHGQIFTTAKDNQTQVDIHVLQGERALVVDNISLGEFTLDDIPLARRGEPQIDVTFQIDSNGILKVSALDLHTDHEISKELSSTNRLSKEQIHLMLEGAKINKEDDERRIKEIQTGILAVGAIASAQMVLEEDFEVLGKHNLDDLEEGIIRVKKAMAEGKSEKIEEATSDLTKRVKNNYDKINREKRKHI